MRIKGISRNVFALGWVSFLTDVASEMLYPVMPLFLVGTLGATPALLGLIDGIAEGGSSVLRWLSGALSDRFRRRKPFVVAGYTLSAFSKPVMGLAAWGGGWPLFMLGRCADRVGKSIRTSARDALISDSTEPEYRGVAFGLHRTMDTCGAILGPLLALFIILKYRNWPLQWLFIVALAPGLISSLVASLAVKDIPHEANRNAKPPSIWQRFPKSLWVLIAAMTVFSFGNSSDAFLILRSRELLAHGGAISAKTADTSLVLVVLAFAIYNFVYAALATPLGKLSDRMGRKPVMAAGWIVYALVYLGFSAAHQHWAPWGLLAVYGVYQAFTEGVSKAFISDLVSKEQRAGAIGLFYTFSGVAQFGGTLAAGCLWNVRLLNGSIMTAFLLGAVCSAAAVPLVLIVPTKRAGEPAAAATVR